MRPFEEDNPKDRQQFNLACFRIIIIKDLLEGFSLKDRKVSHDITCQIIPLLDAWDGLPNDLRRTIQKTRPELNFTIQKIKEIVET